MTFLTTLASRLGRKDAINWLSVVSVMVFQTCASLITSGINFYSELGLFLSVRLGSLLVFIALLLLGHWLLAKASRPQPVITIASFLVGIVASTTVFDWLLVVTELAEQSFLVRRVVLSLGGVSVILVMVALVVTTAREYAVANRDLESAISRVAAVRADTTERITQRRDDLVSRIRDIITSQLDQASLTGSEAKEVMQHLIDDVIRPLSHSLSREAPPPYESSLPQARPIPWRGVIRGALLGNPFSPWAFPVAMGLIVATFLVMTFGLLGTVVTVAIFVVSSVANRGLSVLWRLVPPSAPLALRFVAVSLAVVPFLVFTVVFVNWSTGFDLASSPVRLSAWAIIVMGTWWVAVLATSTFSQLKASNAELETTLAILKTELAAINGVDHQLRHRFARVLHGPIQEAVASALRSITNNQGIATDPDIISATRQRVTEALSGLELHKPDTLDISHALDDVRDVWEGSVAIESDVSEATLQVLSAHSDTAHTVLELVREACHNAIKHGDALTIRITIEADPTRESIHIAVHNDGAQPPPHPVPGVGSALFDALTVSWSRTLSSEGVVVAGIVPLRRP